MRLPPVSWFLVVAATLLAVSSPVSARAPYMPSAVQLDVVNRTSGQTLQQYASDGQLFVEGRHGDRYELVVNNTSGGRILAVVSVDGINVVSGKPAAPSQTGYIVEPGQSITIDGWRKSLNRAAAFYFTTLADSYAGRTGRPNDVGVIGVAIFAEAAPPPPIWRSPQVGRAQESGPAAAQDRNDMSSVPSAKAQAESLAGAPAAPRMGTGHGESIDSRVRQGSFVRASSSPSQIIAVRYESRAALQRMGVLPTPRPLPVRPNAFPGNFVPDPPAGR